jgi:hypothetical protein
MMIKECECLLKAFRVFRQKSLYLKKIFAGRRSINALTVSPVNGAVMSAAVYAWPGKIN